MSKNQQTTEPRKPKRFFAKSLGRSAQQKLDHDEHYDLDGVTRKNGKFTTLDEELAPTRKKSALLKE